MRREELYLIDIVEAADAVVRFMTGIPREAFVKDELVRSAVLHKLTIIGEAAARLPSEFRNAHPQVEWADIIGFRNIAVHAYFAVEWRTVWIAATQDVPILRTQIAEILQREFPSI
jgi:uncharacterized protein with HEPN domain